MLKSIRRKWEKVIMGEKKSFSHLKPHTNDITIEANPLRDLAEVSFKMHVRYSSHCISWGSKYRDKSINFDEIGHEFKIIDENGYERCFCPERYDLSFKLRDIMNNILEKNCFPTKWENWLVIEVVDDKTGKRQDYDIFFILQKQSDEMLSLYIQSAYIRTENIPPPHVKKRSKIQAKRLFIRELKS